MSTWCVEEYGGGPSILSLFSSSSQALTQDSSVGSWQKLVYEGMVPRFTICHCYAHYSLRFPGLAIHVNDGADTSRHKPAVDVTPWRKWNIQNRANYDFRDANRHESAKHSPVGYMTRDDGRVTNHLPHYSKVPRQFGIWNIKKKTKPKFETSIFDDTDNTPWTERRDVPSKFILVLVRYCYLQLLHLFHDLVQFLVYY